MVVRDETTNCPLSEATTHFPTIYIMTIHFPSIPTQRRNQAMVVVSPLGPTEDWGGNTRVK